MPKEIPGQYRLIDKIPPKLYVFLQQTAGQSGNVSFGTVVTDNTQLSFDGVKRYEGMIDGVSTPLYAFGGSESIYGETNRIDTLKAIAQSSDQTLSPFGAITLNTQTAVTISATKNQEIQLIITIWWRRGNLFKQIEKVNIFMNPVILRSV